MKVSTFIGKGVLPQMSEMLNSFSTLEEKINNGKVIDIASFINKSDAWFCDDISDFDFTDPKNKDLLTLLASNGKLPSRIPASSTFETLIREAKPFGLSIMDPDPTKSLSPLPTFSLTELIEIVKEKDTHFEPIISEVDPIESFSKYAYRHKINSVIINDRFFLKGPEPHKVPSKLLNNYIDERDKGFIVITIFCSDDSNEVPKEDLETLMQNELMKAFHNYTFIVELVRLKKIKENHDRMMFTDLLCCKSGNSFSFLNRSSAFTSFDRYMLIDTKNFLSAIKYLNEFLAGVFRSKPGMKTKNRIINSFIQESF